MARCGTLVPEAEFEATVHSVFARACNLECGDTLLTLAAPTLAAGPTTLLLGRDAARDLRSSFRRGDPLRCRRGRIESQRATLDLRQAVLWRAPGRRPALAPADVATRLALARARLAHFRAARPSVLDRSGEDLIAKMERACEALDGERVARHATCLIGWGEGLTPAGDDFLVGFLAALDALAGGEVERRAFMLGLGEFITAASSRTTRISAHYLRLAAHGYFNDDVLRAVDALRSEADLHLVQSVLDAALAVGATSGADTITGIVSGFAAWAGALKQQRPL